ncbi:OLC1v1006220C2 [Oldenlandia corymbosa var. corymbosa]|uniref:OLC1v1006220C2 n=1 Tax=Oldenlandia corymbosa var. corymbosa TaxID=529605 RepID=A0AAV1DHU9_OLDCO|nr:OLC1v1006220C2 [Oldenlandia corymbosa var. corymbosa]
MRKKRRSRGSKQGGAGAASPPGQPQDMNSGGQNPIDGEKKKLIENLVAAFGSVSFQEAAAALKEAKGDANKAADILAETYLVEESGSTSSSGFWTSSSGSSVGASTSSGSSSSSEASADANVSGNGARNQKCRAKKVVAVAGTVSTMLGKDYVRSVQKRTSLKSKGFNEGSWSEAEQFLWSMLGEESELSMDVVSDVLCGCGYDVQKALNILLELTSSLAMQSQLGKSDANINGDSFDDDFWGSTDRTSDSASHSSETELRENEGYKEHFGRSHLQVLTGNYTSPAKSPVFDPELSQQVLASLFNMPTPKSAEREPNSMNWSNIVRKMTSLGQGIEASAVETAMEYSSAKGDDYQVLRQNAKQHWESMKLCYTKAASAFSNGNKDYATYMSEQGRKHNMIARESEEKASRDIFESRNKGIENVITIDLHGQHVKQAMRLLKLHLLFGAYVRSVRSFRVITGCGSHGLGKSKLKQSVVNLLEREGITWAEENRGSLLVRLDQQKEFSFLDSDDECDD